MKYEDKLKRLEEIVSQLEKGGQPLDKALDLYKEGVSLSVECKKELENAKLQINTVMEDSHE